MAKTIKISDRSYQELNNYAGFLRTIEKKPVSVDEALSKLLRKAKEANMDDFAGSWSISDKEIKNIKRVLKRSWKAWKIR